MSGTLSVIVEMLYERWLFIWNCLALSSSMTREVVRLSLSSPYEFDPVGLQIGGNTGAREHLHQPVGEILPLL